MFQIISCRHTLCRFTLVYLSLSLISCTNVERPTGASKPFTDTRTTLAGESQTKNQIASSTGDVAEQENGRSLILAARYGHLDVVKTLVDRNVDVNYRDELGRTALIAAASEPSDRIVKVLIKNGADVNASTYDGDSALMSAARKGLISNMTILIKHKANINQLNNKKETALIEAVKYGHKEAVRILLENKADPNLYDQDSILVENGMTPLMYAAEYSLSSHNTINIISQLHAKGADINIKRNNGDTALSIAEKKGNKLVAQRLRSLGARDETLYSGLSPEEALLRAIKSSNNEKVNELLENGADPDYRNQLTGITPLLTAAYHGNAEAVKLLINYGVDIDRIPLGLDRSRINTSSIPVQDRELALTASRGDSALLTAIRYRNTNVALELIKNGAHIMLPNKNNDTPGKISAQLGNHIVMRALLNKGLDPNMSDVPLFVDGRVTNILTENLNMPLLIEATRNDQQITVEVLLQGEANPNIKDEKKRTALFWASSDGLGNIVGLLLQYKSDPNITDESGMSPLMVAAKSGYGKIVNLLLEHGADYNAIQGNNSGFGAGNTGMTALIFAARGGHSDIVKMLLKTGADSALRNLKGESALDIARQSGHQEVVQILEDALR